MPHYDKGCPYLHLNRFRKNNSQCIFAHIIEWPLWYVQRYISHQDKTLVFHVYYTKPNRILKFILHNFHVHCRKFLSFSTMWTWAKPYSCLRIFQLLQLKSIGISGVFQALIWRHLDMDLVFQGTNQIYSLQMAFTTCSTTSRSVVERRCDN